ncbi:hypothetical protein PIB30_041844 [Stylosanthes scabra]|uniref:Transposase MuDR plant domain-containing protein n=1 Tax=Stylosanthes scabra TaxID=79078 RepID=A0ABU6SFW0_9FABA|nr:hypothetical protein [Stylosanthes scabra]
MLTTILVACLICIVGPAGIELCTCFRPKKFGKFHTSDSLRNPLDEENPLMRDILNDISDHEDDFLHCEEDGVDVNLDQPFEVGEGQMVAVRPPSYHVPPSSQFSDINWDAMDGSNKFPRHQTFKVEDSDSKRLIVKCPKFGDGCNWRAWAICSKRSGA